MIVGVASIDTQYTFSNTKLNRYSTIDFVCFSKKLKPFVSIYKVVDCISNHSNHRPVIMVMDIPVHDDRFYFINSDRRDVGSSRGANNATPMQSAFLRWDRAQSDQ